MKRLDKIRCYDLEGNFLQDFDSLDMAAMGLDIDKDKIKVGLIRTTKCLNYQFRYGNCDTNHIGSIVVKRERKKPVSKYWNGNLITVYDSINEAAIKNDMNTSSISQSCKKGYKAFGFTFKYI